MLQNFTNISLNDIPLHSILSQEEIIHNAIIKTCNFFPHQIVIMFILLSIAYLISFIRVKFIKKYFHTTLLLTIPEIKVYKNFKIDHEEINILKWIEKVLMYAIQYKIITYGLYIILG